MGWSGGAVVASCGAGAGVGRLQCWADSSHTLGRWHSPQISIRAVSSVRVVNTNDKTQEFQDRTTRRGTAWYPVETCEPRRAREF